MNRKLSILLTILLILLSINTSFGQFYTSGSDPARAEWRYIRTEWYDIIYPMEIDSLARRYALILESSRDAVNLPLNAIPKRIPVVLHPYNVMSNGLVSWAPKRMELLTRPQSIGGYSQNWEKQLIIHESRHVSQITKFERGVFRPLSWLIGEQAQGLGIGLFINKWAIEGDAVVSETELSFSGRGRDPLHLVYYKAAFLEGDIRNYQHWAFGSFAHYTPDEYSLGYLLNSSIRFRTGKYNFMGELTESVVDNFYSFKNSTKSYRKSTGKTINENLKETVKLMVDHWKISDSLRSPFTVVDSITKKKREYTSYRSAIVISKDSIFAVKNDLDETNRLVMINGPEGDNTLTFLGILSSEPFYFKGKIYWTEQIPSLRWEQESFSDLIEYDLKTDKTRRLTHKLSVYNPSFSSSGQSIIAAEYPVAGSSNLVFIDIESGLIFKRFRAPQNGQIKESIQIGETIYATVITEKGLGIYKIDPAKGVWERVVAEQHQNISRLSNYKGKLLFESDLEGVNELFHFDPEIKILRRLTNSRLAAVSPYYFPEDDVLYYSDFTKKGFGIVAVPSDSLEWSISDFSRPHRYFLAEELSNQAGFRIDTVSFEGVKNYASRPYSTGDHVFHIHSWTPFYFDIDNLKNISYDNFYDIASLGATVYSQNALGTATSMFGYSYHNGFNTAHAKFRYSGLYPVIDIKTDLNDRDRQKIRLVSDDPFHPVMQADTITGSPLLNFSLLVYLPLNLSKGGWVRGLIPRFAWQYSNDSYYSINRREYSDYQHINFGIQYYQMLRMKKRNIFPKWGYGINFQINSMPFSRENFGSTIYLNGYSYLPGFLNNQGLKISATFQRQIYNGKRYLMKNIAPSPRGYDTHYSITYASVFTDYAIPVNLGNLTLSSVLYLKRLQLIPFFDWAFSHGMDRNRHMISGGADLLFDFNALNISVPLSAGVRYIRTAENKNFVQFLFQAPL